MLRVVNIGKYQLQYYVVSDIKTEISIWENGCWIYIHSFYDLKEEANKTWREKIRELEQSVKLPG